MSLRINGVEIELLILNLNESWTRFQQKPLITPPPGKNHFLLESERKMICRALNEYGFLNENPDGTESVSIDNIRAVYKRLGGE